MKGKSEKNAHQANPEPKDSKDNAAVSYLSKNWPFLLMEGSEVESIIKDIQFAENVQMEEPHGATNSSVYSGNGNSLRDNTQYENIVNQKDNNDGKFSINAHPANEGDFTHETEHGSFPEYNESSFHKFDDSISQTTISEAKKQEKYSNTCQTPLRCYGSGESKELAFPSYEKYETKFKKSNDIEQTAKNSYFEEKKKPVSQRMRWTVALSQEGIQSGRKRKKHFTTEDLWSIWKKEQTRSNESLQTFTMSEPLTSEVMKELGDFSSEKTLAYSDTSSSICKRDWKTSPGKYGDFFTEETKGVSRKRKHWDDIEDTPLEFDDFSSKETSAGKKETGSKSPGNVSEGERLGST